MSKIFYIYNGIGTCNYSSVLCNKWLQKFGKTQIIQNMNQIESSPLGWLCIAGGKGSDVLRGQQYSNELYYLHNFIKNGGNYFGICCGAYLATNKIYFEGTLKNNGFGFVDATSVGPAFDFTNKPFSYNFLKESSILKINYNGTYLDAYYHGGGYFDNIQNCNVVSTYMDGKKCIITRPNDKTGKIVLSFVHPEHEKSRLDDVFATIL